MNLLALGVPIVALLARQDPPLTLESAVRRALQDNPRALAAARQALSAASGAASARALRNPDVLLAPALTPNGTDNELYAEQFFELNGVRSARSAAAAARLRAARFAQLGAFRSLAYDTTLAYYAVARQEQRLAAEREGLAVAEDLERVARRQVDLGSRPGIEQVQAEVETLRARRAVRAAEGELQAAQASLETLLGAEDAPPESLEVAPLPTTVSPIEATEAAAVAQSAEVREQEALADALKEDARQEAAQGRPDLGVAAVSQSFTREPRTGGVGLVLSLPVLDYGSRRNRVAELRLAEQAQRARAAAARNEARGALRRARARLKAAEDGLAPFEGGILERARRLLDASRVGFQAGQTTIVSILEAQRTYRTAQTEYVEARGEYALARAEVEHAAGTLGAPAIDELLSQGAKK